MPVGKEGDSKAGGPRYNAGSIPSEKKYACAVGQGTLPNGFPG